MIDLVVAECGLMLRTPIDDILAPVHEPFLKQADKDFFHGIREPFIHREPFAFPIAETRVCAAAG